MQLAMNSHEMRVAVRHGGRFEGKMVINQQDSISLADLPLQQWATVYGVSRPSLPEDQALVQRLVEIGFVPGERIKIIAVGHPGHEPIAVRVGHTTFALRRFEAEFIRVSVDAT